MTGKKILNLKDINIAIAQDNGLAVPVIEKADSLSINQIGQQSGKLIEKAKSGSLDPSAMPEATFTITNLGMYDIDCFTAIINPPESAILAIGKINKKPVADEGQVVIKPIITLSLTYDYRIIDGVAAAKFLLSIKKLILNPYLILFN
jgi:pyruvate dehydrogenase E2 component (dihydrolipoamide acetyltransferase)